MINPTDRLRIAMVMAAGYGTRMKNLTQEVPKPLLSLGELTVIDVILFKLARQGIERAVVNVHYLAENMKAHLRNGARYGLELIISEEPEILGSGGGIANADQYFEGETILVVNADVLCDIRLPDLFTHHQQAGVQATMTVLSSRNNHDYTLVLYDHEENLTGFLGKDESIPPAFQSGIFTGHQILTAEARTYLRPEYQSVITRVYKRALEKGDKVNIFPFEGRWLDVGTKEFYRSFVKKIKAGEIDLNDFMAEY